MTFYLKRALRNHGKPPKESLIADEVCVQSHPCSTTIIFTILTLLQEDYSYNGPRLRGKIERRKLPYRNSINEMSSHGKAVPKSTLSSSASKRPGSKTKGVPRRLGHHEVSYAYISCQCTHTDCSGLSQRTTSRTSVLPPAFMSQLGSQPTAVVSNLTRSSRRQGSTNTASNYGNVSNIEPREPVDITGTPAAVPQALTAPGTRRDAPTANSILPLLSLYHIPRADAERLAGILASAGIADVSYLRVLACMRGRDDWLREMRDKEQISEIQMRVLQEILRSLDPDA